MVHTNLIRITFADRGSLGVVHTNLIRIAIADHRIAIAFADHLITIIFADRGSHGVVHTNLTAITFADRESHGVVHTNLITITYLISDHDLDFRANRGSLIDRLIANVTFRLIP